MKKICIVGPSGAGKSTFSLKLSDMLDIPVYHLDNVFWNKDKSHIDRDEFDLRLTGILAKDRWIIDGDYSRTYRMRFEKADTVFFLDFDLNECLDGVKSRTGRKRVDCPFVENEPDPEFEQWIKDWFVVTRPVITKLLENAKDKEIIVFRTRNDIREYIKKNCRKTLKITSGDCLNDIMTGRYPYDSFIPFREAMINGSYSSELFSEAFAHERAAYHRVPVEEYKEKLKCFTDILDDPTFYEVICMYFGDEPFCRANKKAVIEALSAHGYKGTLVIHIVDETTGDVLSTRRYDMSREFPELPSE